MKKVSKLDNRGFEKPELIVIVATLALIIIVGIIIGSIIIGTRKNQQGTIKVSYDSNGGTGSMENTECKIGSNCLLKNNTFTKDGYDFVGWGTSESENNATYKINDTYLARENTTLYAMWKIKEITITYDANGGTGLMPQTTYTYGDPKILLLENKYEKKGYTFNSWHIYNPTLDQWYGCTDKDAICDDTKANSTLGWHDRNEITAYYDNKVDWNTTNSEYDLIYYAQWGESTYEITYVLNGGTNGKDAPISGVFGSTVKISNPTKEGCTFKGWTVDGTEAKIEGTELTIGTSNVTLTANWTAKITDYIQHLYNNSTLRKENSLDKDETIDANIRFVGSNPNNYIKFNDELWRIVGVFNTSNGFETSKRVKLIREDNLLNASWDSSASSINNGKGINEWTQSDIKIVLNDYYVGNSPSCSYCNGIGQSTCSISCSNNIKKMSNTAKNMIENAVWYTGGFQYGGSDGDEITSVLDVYTKERGNRSGKTDCKPKKSGGNCTDTVTRTTKWNGLVGLIYPSDYGYASTNSNCHSDISYNHNCYYNNWLNTNYNYWTITPRDSNWFANAGWQVVATWGLGDDVMSSTKGIRPVVYLKSNIQVVAGTGTKADPYILDA